MIAAALCSMASLAAAANATTRSSASICPRTVVGLVTTLNSIDRRLDIGVSFDTYGALVSRANVADGRIASGTESAACASRVGVPAARALNAYIAAYKSWSTCIDWYDSPRVQNDIEFGGNPPTCEKGPGHGYAFRERQWTIASGNVRRAINALG